MVLEQLDIHMQKKKKILDKDLSPFTNIYLKWIVDLNLNYKTSGRKHRLGDFGFGNDFLVTPPKAQCRKGSWPRMSEMPNL